MNKNTHGGKRKGSGQKLKYGEATTTVSFRVPISGAEDIKKTVRKKLKNLRNQLNHK